MLQLAELKLHIHDEYAKNTNAKQRLKRHIAGAPRSTETTQSAIQASSSATAPLAQTSHSTEIVEDETNDNTASSAGPAEGSLRTIADQLIAMANEDDNDDDQNAASPQKFTLTRLFDFTVDYWLKSSEATGYRGLQDELELYELIDMDASGELDTDIDVDSMAEALLTSQ